MELDVPGWTSTSQCLLDTPLPPNIRPWNRIRLLRVHRTFAWFSSNLKLALELFQTYAICGSGVCRRAVGGRVCIVRGEMLASANTKCFG